MKKTGERALPDGRVQNEYAAGSHHVILGAPRERTRCATVPPGPRPASPFPAPPTYDDLGAKAAALRAQIAKDRALAAKLERDAGVARIAEQEREAEILGERADLVRGLIPFAEQELWAIEALRVGMAPWVESIVSGPASAEHRSRPPARPEPPRKDYGGALA